MNHNGFDDFKSAAIPDREIIARKIETPITKRYEAKRRQQFIKVPIGWVDQLAKTRHRAAYPVALSLLRAAWKHHDKPVTLSNEMLIGFGVSRKEKRLALAELEAIGLVTVERPKGKAAPRVTLLKV